MNIFLIIILPSLAAGTIHVDIIPATETSNATVLYSGSDNWLITEKDQEAFEITNKHIAWNLPRRRYKAPTYVYLRRASRFGYRDVTVTLTPIGAEIVGHKKRSVIVTVKEFSNNVTVPTTFKGGVKEEVTETLSTTWSKSEELSASGSILLKFGERTISYRSSWGEEVHKSATKTISTYSDVEMTLQPGQRAKAVLKATRAVLEVKVDYEASVEGEIVCMYTFFWIPYQGKQFEVKDYFDLMKLPHFVRSSEIVTVDYYYGAQIDVMDGDQKVPFELV